MLALLRLPFRLLIVGTLVCGGLACLTVAANANDGGLAMGGSPRLLDGHPSVTMTSEIINISVAQETMTVDCRFVFTNDGPACTVRMGFPDEGEGANDPDEDLDPKDLAKTPPHTTFLTFQSWVDGKPAPTKLIRANEKSHFWHTKLVAFPAHGVRQVRDLYTQRVGGGITNSSGRSGSAEQIAYVLHTGASWHGAIGRSEINITFKSNRTPNMSHLLPLREVSSVGNARDLSVTVVAPDSIVWEGPCPPQAKGKTLQFVRENWRPTAKDDIKLTYNYRIVNTK